MFYACFTLLGLLVVPSQPFLWPSSQWWEGFLDPRSSLMRVDIQCYYFLYMGRYAQAVISVLLEPKRKDFLEMLVHHIVTITVIPISYWSGWYRVGAVIMVLFDPADVPLHIA